MLVKIFKRMALCMLVAAVVFCAFWLPVTVGAAEAEAEAETETSVTQQKPIIDIIKEQDNYVDPKILNQEFYSAEIQGCDFSKDIIFPIYAGAPEGTQKSDIRAITDFQKESNDLYALERPYLIFADDNIMVLQWQEWSGQVVGETVEMFDKHRLGKAIEPAVRDILNSNIYDSPLHTEDNIYEEVLCFCGDENDFNFFLVYIGSEQTVVASYSSTVGSEYMEFTLTEFNRYYEMCRRYNRNIGLNKKGDSTSSSGTALNSFVKKIEDGQLTEQKLDELEKQYERNYKIHLLRYKYHGMVAGIACVIIVVAVGAVVTVIIVKRKKKRARLQAEASLAESGTESAENTEAKKIE